jgi:hypothetical protein
MLFLITLLYQVFEPGQPGPYSTDDHLPRIGSIHNFLKLAVRAEYFNDMYTIYLDFF